MEQREKAAPVGRGDEKFYRITSWREEADYVTTNDREYADRLIRDGWQIIATPEFVSQFGDCARSLVESVPFVVRIPRDRSLSENHLPIGRCGSALGELY